MRFRKFKKRDAEKCFKLIRDSLNADSEVSENLRREILQDNNPKKIIAMSKQINYYLLVKGIFREKIIAMGGFKNDGEIKTVYSNIKFRSKGHGEKMMNFLENKAKKKGIQKLFLWSSPKAVNFYQKFGFGYVKKDKTGKLQKIL